MKSIFYSGRAALSALFLFFIFAAQSQTPYSVLASGLKHPNGIIAVSYNEVWITETGNGANDGQISILRYDGSVHPVLTGLPSVFDTATHEFEGAWSVTLIPGHGFAVVIGPQAGPYGGSVLFFDVPGYTPGVSPALTPDKNTRQVMVSKFMYANGFPDSDPYSADIGADGNLYVSDAGANAVVKFTPANVGSVFLTLPDIKNPSSAGPPMVNQVPTKIIARPEGGFYLSTLTGFPFNEGAATIYSVSAAGVATPYKTGLTMAVDMALTSVGELFVLQYGKFQFAPTPGYAPNSAKIIKIKLDGTTQLIADNFGPGSGLSLDPFGDIWVTEKNSGRVLEFFQWIVDAQSAFFYENFDHGIPATWTTKNATPGAKWVWADSTSLKAINDKYYAHSADYWGFALYPDEISYSGNFLRGSAALQAVHQKGMDATLTSPAINCTGKNQVFLAFSEIGWTGTSKDSIPGSGNLDPSTVVRVSNDGKTWTEFKGIDNGYVVANEGQYYDISAIAANQPKVYIQFRRTGDEENGLWVVDDVALYDQAPLRKITLSVDMSNEKVSPKGVYIATDVNGWKPNAIKMSPIGNGIYSGSVVINQGTTFRYKFMNGDSWGENESVPSGCGLLNAQGYYDRIASANIYDVNTPVVCFGACIQCGNRKPQSSYYYCSKDPNIIYCENFEGLQFGKLIPQASHWTTGSLLHGGTLATETTIPDVVSYWNGFVNYDGSKSLHIGASSNDSVNTYGGALMYLGSPKEGKYQIDLKMYITKGSVGTVSLDDTTSHNTFLFTIASDSVYVFNNPRYAGGKQVNKMNKAIKTNDWNDVSMTFNVATRQISLRFNNDLLFNDSVPAQVSYNFLDFSPFPESRQSLISNDYFIDDILYRRLPNTASLEPRLASANFGAFPNPADQTLTIAPELKMSDAWEARLINSLGQVVWSGKSADLARLEVETGALQPGLYVVDVQSATDRWTKKVTIQH